ncbi:radical SAM protein [Candidatus Latescibacterota bacterium]
MDESNNTSDIDRQRNITSVQNNRADNGSSDFEPAYMELHRSGELKKRGKALWDIMESCRLCPRKCGVNRLEGNEGFCHASSQLEISSFNPHFGEERPLVGRGGSGTIFLTNCGLRCVFCINWGTSHEGLGESCNFKDMAKMMLRLQQMGCHNINVVTPTHYSPHVVLALDIAAEYGLRLPLVYNTCGWELTDILGMLDGVVDIYLPDLKYSNGDMAGKYSAGAVSYPDLTKKSLLEMHCQVGTAKPASDGIMYRGLMIRHLVMPNKVSGSKDVIDWIANNLPKDTFVNIMSQYRPMYRADEFPDIARGITRREYFDVVDRAKEAGLTNLEIQGYSFFRTP